jgi:exodeoxyribonuclease-5
MIFKDSYVSENNLSGFTLTDVGKARRFVKTSNTSIYALQGYNDKGQGVYNRVNSLGLSLTAPSTSQAPAIRKKAPGRMAPQYGAVYATRIAEVNQEFINTLNETVKMSKEKYDSGFIAEMQEVEKVTEQVIETETEALVQVEDFSDYKIEPGQFVKYENETYIITKLNNNGTVQIYNPTKDSNVKLSVSPINLTIVKAKGKTVNHKGTDYIVTPKLAIISTISNKVMNWAENNGDRIAILKLANPSVPTTNTTSESELPNNSKPAFTPANEQQREAINSIKDFILNGDPSKMFTVEGKAGTGKTTIVQEAIADAVASRKNIGVAALSHKAKLVLADKLETRFGKRAVESASMAGLLGIKLNEETHEFVADPFAEAMIDTLDVIIIDEASMINEEMLATIISRKRKSAKLIFLGDRGQLPPIRELNKNDFYKDWKKSDTDIISPVFKSELGSQLTERVRQGEESPILPFADFFWDNANSEKGIIDPVPEGTNKDVLSDKGNLVFAKNMVDVFDEVVDTFKRGIETFNPNLIKIVTYRNATRQSYNSKIRKAIYGANPADFLVGDIVMFTDNFSVVGREPISNSSEFSISSRKEAEVDGYDAIEITFKDADIPTRATLYALAESSKAQYKADVAELFAIAKALPRGFAKKDAVARAWTLARRFVPIDYAYAITSHKSQGSTYETVIVDVKDISGVSATTNKSKSRSIYTGITRASKTAIIINGKTEATPENVSQALGVVGLIGDSLMSALKTGYAQNPQLFSEIGINSIEEIPTDETEQKEILRRFCMGF